MAILHKNITAAADIHNPKWFSGANSGDYAFKNEKGELESIDELLLPAALNFVDGSVAPPTTNSGDIYILSSGGSVNAGWGGVSLQDWVRYDGTAWNSITPQKSSLCYDKTADALKFFNGSAWAGMGGGIQGVTSAEKAALSPTNGDFVYDTDLDSLQRYDGSVWVDVSKGYGLISVNSTTGVPTFYIDLQTALETCKTGTNTVTLHSNIALSAQININYSGSGVGSGYNFNNLTINLNGYSLSYDAANSDAIIDAHLFSTPPNLKIINGQIIRTNATSGYALSFQRTTFYASNLIVDSNKSCLEMGTISCNAYLGGSYFIARGTTEAIRTNTGTIKDFIAINTSSGIGFYMSSTVAQNFYCESDSGAALRVLGGNADNFKAHSNSGYGVWHPSSTTCKLTNFEANSNSSAGIRRSGYGTSTWHLSNFRVLNGGIQLDGSITTSRFSNFTVFCDFNTALRGQVHGLNFYNGTFESDGAYHTSLIGANNKFENVSFIGNDFETVNFVDVGNVNNSVLKNCNFTCLLDTSSGHAIDVGGIDSGNADFMNCTFQVVNAGANCITASSAETITVLNSSFKGATTPINANVTITASTDQNNGNRSI